MRWGRASQRRGELSVPPGVGRRIGACHLLTYLALCARRGGRIVSYEDEVRGTPRLPTDGGGRFEAVLLHPIVAVAGQEQVALAEQLHSRAHQLCFIANRCSVPIYLRPVVRVA